MDLARYASNVYSQHGEDGILAELLDRIETSTTLSRWCVEFGAADGVWLSNTCNLIRTRGFRAVMIEGDARRGRLLAQNHPGDEVVKLVRMVGLDGEDSLDSILDGCDVPSDIDVISIDIDGYDYWVLESIRSHLPKVVVIEFNPTMPNGLEYIQPRDSGGRHGSSPRSIIDLAESKGYRLVAVTRVNLILVREDLLEAVLGVGTAAPRLEELRDDSDRITYIFTALDGTVLMSRPRLLFPWLGVEVDVDDLQVIPRPWRSVATDWPARGLRKQSWRLWRLLDHRLHWVRRRSGRG